MKWRAKVDMVVDDNGRVVAAVMGPTPEVRANRAALIAQAPEMLKLLTRLHPILVAFSEDYERVDPDKMLETIERALNRRQP